ncbi:MAG TPA: LysM peptidoglycan-binding domain-containing protein [Anaerolineae bacterium]|nr:LysM peptidoglycan-binding domain-containing protein [Anaerolineae bacterium]
MLPKVSFRSILISIIILLIAAMPIGLAMARSARSEQRAVGELLTNPGFEDPFIQAGTADLFVADGWAAWYITPDGVNFPSECPENAPATCVPYRVPVYHNTQPQDPHAPERARSGNSQQWGISYAVYIAGVYQHVANITPGTRLRFSAFMQGFNCSDNRGCYGGIGQYAHSYEPGDMHMRVGIDPTGGQDPFGANVVWSGYQNPLDAFGLIQVEAVAQANSVTVFLWSAPNYPELHTDIYVDDASLIAVSQGAVTPPAQPAGTAQPVPTVPSGPGTYTIQPGDTLFAIAFANNLTLDQLLALNPGLTRDTVLQVGQVIKTGGATSASTPAPQSTSAPTIAPTSALAVASSTPGGPTTYTVKAGDTLSAIALQFNLTVDQLLSLNGITKDTPLQVGQVLTVGVAAATPTPEATAAPTAAPTSASPLPTPTPAVSASGLCLLAFDDESEAGTFTGSEALVTGVTFDVKGSDGKSLASYTSNGQQEPHCLSNLPDGRYTVDVTLPDGRQATTEIHWSLSLLSGTSVNVNIGTKPAPIDTATPAVTATPPTAAASQSGGGTFALIAGAALIVIAGIALFIGLRSRKK